MRWSTVMDNFIRNWYYSARDSMLRARFTSPSTNEHTAIIPYSRQLTPAHEDTSDNDECKNQLLLTCAASLGYFTIGLVRGFSATAVISMEKSDSHIIQNLDAESWISSIPPLGALVGSLCAGPFLEHYGRRHTLMASSPLFVFSWSCIALANSYEMMLAARFMTGFCVGIVLPSAQIYVSECSAPNVRGILGSLPSLFMAGGILMSYILGAFLSWKPLAWVSAVFPAVLLFVLIPLPESPAWLLSKGRTADAALAVKWLHHTKKTVEELKMELRTDEGNFIPADAPPQNTNQRDDNDDEHPLSFHALFQRPVIIPFLLSLALLAFQQLSGIDAIIFYTVAIFQSSGSPLNDNLATILVGLVQLVSNFTALFVVDRAGRKPLLIASGFLMSVSMGSLGLYFFLLERNKAEAIHLLPLISLLVFMVGFSIGFCSLPFLLMGELLPLKQRSFFSSIAGSFNLGVMFVVIKTYPNLKHAIGSAGTFWLYAGFCACSCLFVGFLVPETKGKSLEEIEEHFQMKHVSKKSTVATL